MFRNQQPLTLQLYKWSINSAVKYVKHAIHIFHLKPNPAGYHSGFVVGQGLSYTGNFPWFQNFVPSSGVPGTE